MLRPTILRALFPIRVIRAHQVAILHTLGCYAYTTDTSTASVTLNESPLARPHIKASAFTGRADYYEALFFLQDILKQAQSHESADIAPQTVRIPWYPVERMADLMGFSLTRLQYRKLCSVLHKLTAYAHLPTVRGFLGVFSPAELEELLAAKPDESRKILAKFSGREPNLGFIDDLGRAISIGKRKSAEAKVYLVRGSGECYVNGVPAIEYFKSPHEMFKISDPYNATSTFGRYNAWCIVKGGGLSGQAGAIAHGVAKAMVLMDPKMRQPLLSSTLLISLSMILIV